MHACAENCERGVDEKRRPLQERVFRNTHVFEVVERPVQQHFSNKRYRKHRKSPIFRKCEDLMEILWEDGYQKEIPWNRLRDYVMRFCGSFRTTITDYLGKRATFYKSRGKAGVLKSAARIGYLERFGFIKKKSPKIISLIHERVDRSYHYQQTNVVSFSLSKSTEGSNIETAPIGALDRERGERDRQSERENRVSKSVLTPDELRILQSTRDGRG